MNSKNPGLISATDPLLNRKAKTVAVEEVNTPHIRGVIDSMLKLSAGKGHSAEDTRQMVGLAAPQIGVSKRIITIDLDADGSNKQQRLQVVINPVITHRSAETAPGREGCWSCGNICGIVERSSTVTLEGISVDGEPIELKLAGFTARIAQHETDHLDSIRFPERIPANEPEHLHLVQPAEFETYRTNWMHWSKLCPREEWEQMKAGTTP